MNKTTRLPDDACPHCKHEISAATSTEGGYKPSSGDFTVCAYCGAICSFDVALRMKILGDEERDWLKQNPDVRAKLTTLSYTITRRNKRG